MTVEQTSGTSTWVHAPRQARSQETFDRFLGATADLLAERSFDDITVTDIVKRADRTVGSFYARFDDKYAVLHELVERSYEHIRSVVRAFCDPLRWENQPISNYVSESVRVNVIAYRRASPLFRAALRAATSDERFRESRLELVRFCAEQQKALLLSRGDELRATDPGRASDLVFEIVVAMLDAELLFGGLTTTSATNDHEFCAEITDVALHVLGLDPAPDAPRLV